MSLYDPKSQEILVIPNCPYVVLDIILEAVLIRYIFKVVFSAVFVAVLYDPVVELWSNYVYLMID